VSAVYDGYRRRAGAAGVRWRSGPAERAPLYARVLRLRGVHPGGLLCFLFFEGMIALGALLALAELTSWWAVPVLPVTVAVMVKVNDVIAVLGRVPAPAVARATAPVPAAPAPALAEIAVARGTASVPVQVTGRAKAAEAPRWPVRNQRRFDRPAM